MIGGSTQLDTILEDRKVEGVIISAPNEIPSEVLTKVVTDCHAKGVWVKMMRLAFETIE